MRDDIGRTGVFLDFDGTLAPIVADPAASRSLPGTNEAIVALAEVASRVSVVSGRPAAFLLERLAVGPKVELHGLYGLQRVVDGEVLESREAARWHDVVDAGATAALAQLPEGVHVERKGVSFVLHYRSNPEFEAICQRWAASFASESGLDAHRGRQSIEIGPLSLTDKGSTVTAALPGLSRICVIGDDLGDLPMFVAAKQALPHTSLNILVASDETPEQLRGVTDISVSGPSAVLEVLVFLAS